MRIVSGPGNLDFDAFSGDLNVVLYGRDGDAKHGRSGAAILKELRRWKIVPHQRAWDFLSIALAVTAADLASPRNRSSDGWTRDFELYIAVAEPDFWRTQVRTLQALLCFLTTDRWRLAFVPGAVYAEQPDKPSYPDNDSVVLLSGGLDSFAGVLDLVAKGRKPFAVTQTVRGDAEKQRHLAALVGDGLLHLQLNHNTEVPDPENPPTQRARSIIFLSYGIFAATTLRLYHDGYRVPLFICENGFISLNPPLTGLRLGSLSTRTSHPVVLALLQRVLDAAGLRIRLENPYAYRTKGELLGACGDQALLRRHAHETTSCGRFKRFGYKHCGRCLPCLIRRAAFDAWKHPDRTGYAYDDLSIDDSDHARSDDVRAAAMAVAEVAEVGIENWLGVTLSSPLLAETSPQLREVASRGLMELRSFLRTIGVV